MSNILVISKREEVVKIVGPICNGKAKVINSSEEAVSYLNKNKPSLVILDLEVKDLNIFVAHELLKVCKSKNRSIVIIVVSEKTKKEVEDYKNLIHPPDEFINDSEIIIHLDELLKKHSILPGVETANDKKRTTDIKTITEELKEDIEELDIFDNALIEDSETSQGIFIVEDANDHSGEIDLSLEDSSEIKTKEIEIKKNKKKGEKKELELNVNITELDAEISFLKKQNASMEKENKELLIKNNELIKSSDEYNQKIDKISIDMKNLNNEVENIKTAKKETIENKDNEIKNLQNNHKDDINTLKSEIEQSKSDKKILESSLMDEISLLKSDKSDLEKENEQLNTKLESLKNEFFEVEKKLTSETKNIENLKKEKISIEKAKDEKEKILISSIDHLKKNIIAEEVNIKEYKDKLDKITKISKSLSEIVKA